jgi:hypothetical protein
VKNLYLIALFVFPLLLSAQKRVDLDRYRFNVQYRALPKLRIDSSYRTYHVYVEGTKLMQSFLKDLEPEKTVRLEGWKKLTKEGHLAIKIKLEDLLPESVSVKEKLYPVKDKTGKVTGSRTAYYQQVIYSFAANAAITDYKGMHIMDQVLADRNTKQVYNSPEFANRLLAEGYFVLNALNVTSDLYRSSVNKAIHLLNKRITDNFGFSEVTVNDYMWVIDSRKHPEYTANRQALQQLNETLFSFSASKPITNAREQVAPAIKYFESIKKKYVSTSKHDRKIRYASYFNLAVLYYYLDDPQSMMKEANGLVLNDFDSKDGQGFERTANWLKNQFQQTNIYTRHFPIDTASFKGPYESLSEMAK